MENNRKGHMLVSEEYFNEPISDVFERELNSCVEFGRPERLEAIFSRMSVNTGNVPKITDNEVSSFRAICLFSTGVISRVALKGGLDYETVNIRCTHYLKKFEGARTYNDLMDHFKNMFVDFAQRTANCRYMLSSTPLVLRISKMIISNLYSKITPTMIAETLGMNVSYLCRHFKQNTGKTISSFINEVKVIESQRQLKYTDITVAQISNRLGFSSQNYFHTVFKNITGQTPLDYRRDALIDN